MDLRHLALTSNFTGFDWGIVAIYLLATVAIGVYVNRYVGNMGDYVVAGRSLNSYIAIATMVGSELGLVTVMYAAQKGFTGGFAAFHIGLVAGVVTLIIGMTGFIVVPLRRLKVLTIPEFYGQRFSPGVRILGAIMLAVSGILNMGLFLKAGALFVTGLTGLNDPEHVKIIMTLLIVLVLVYTILGGMVSVVITDYAQFCVLSFGMILACGFAIYQLGWGHIIDTVQEVHGDKGFNPFHRDGFGPSYVVWMIFTAGIVSCAVWQTAVMRACSASSADVVKKLYAWSSIGFLIRFIVPMFLGICALTYFSTVHGVTEGLDDSEATMQAMPMFLGQILPVGVIGLIAAGMLAAFMSTHDSYLLCWASVLAHDVVGPIAGERLTEKKRLTIARAFILIIGVFLLIWSLWYPLRQDLWDYMAVTGAIYFTGAFAVLLFGLYWERASCVGAYCALIAGGLSILGLKGVQEWLGFEQSSEVIGLSAAGSALVLMVIGSLIFPDKNPKNLSGELA